MKKIIISIILSVFLIMTYSASALSALEIENAQLDGALEYNSRTSMADLADANIIYVHNDDLADIAERAKELVDAGKVLCIVGPEISAEEVARICSIPKDGVNAYNPLPLIAYTIYKTQGIYVFGNNYVFEDNDADIASTQSAEELATPQNCSFDRAITMSEYRQNNGRNGLFREIVQTVNVSIQNLIAEGEVDRALPEVSVQAVSTGGNLSRTYFDNLYVKNSSGDSLGYVRGTVQVYDIGRGIVNDREGYLFNMVTDVKAYPNAGSCVTTYSCSVNCRIQGHFIINTATLPSGISYSRTLSLSGSLTLGTETEIEGSIGYNTTWDYNPESQIITESSPDPDYVLWTAQTYQPQVGKAYGLTPNATIFVAPGYQGQRGAFSNLICNAYTFDGLVNQENELIVGGWF